MRILQLIDSLTVGGAQKLQPMFARAMRGRDVELTVVTLFPSRIGSLAAELRELGVRVEPLHARSPRDPRRALRLLRYLRRGRFDVLFTHLRAANFIGSVAGMIAGVPSIATLHSIGPLQSFGTLESWAVRRTSACVVAVGHAVAEAHRSRLRGVRCEVISNPVETIALTSPAERLENRRVLIGADGPVLMSVGRLAPEKGYLDLLEALAELRRTHPRITLAIVGAGPLDAVLRAQVRGMGLEDHVHLTGHRDDVRTIIATADIYVSASHREGLPLSLLEAMAAGVPAVATDVGDVGTVVVDGTGVLVPPRDPAALAAAVRPLLDNRERARAMGAAGRQHVQQNFGVDRWAERLLQLATEVSGRGRHVA